MARKPIAAHGAAPGREPIAVPHHAGRWPAARGAGRLRNSTGYPPDKYSRLASAGSVVITRARTAFEAPRQASKAPRQASQAPRQASKTPRIFVTICEKLESGFGKRKRARYNGGNLFGKHHISGNVARASCYGRPGALRPVPRCPPAAAPKTNRRENEHRTWTDGTTREAAWDACCAS